MEVSLSLDSLNKIYYAGDFIQGSVLIINKTKSTMKYDLLVKVLGYYTFRNEKENPPKVKGVQFYKKAFKALNDVYSTVGANNSFRFKFPLTYKCEQNSASLYESYHGVSVSVQYDIYAETLSMGKQYISKKKQNISFGAWSGQKFKIWQKKSDLSICLRPKKN